MTRTSWLMLGIAVVLVGCGGDPEGDPEGDPVEEDAAAAAEPADEADEPDEPTDPVEPTESDDTLASPAEVTGPIGVVYEATGSFNDTFGLIQTPDVSVYSNDDVTAYFDAETVTICSSDRPCFRTQREGPELMGMLGGQLVTDMTSFAASMPVASSSTETIAGRDARCIVPEDDELLQEYCYDLVSGIALRWQVVDEGIPTSVTAIEVFEPTAADLTPTGPVEDRADGDIPDLGDFDFDDLDELDLGDFDLGDLNLEDLDLDELLDS